MSRLLAPSVILCLGVLSGCATISATYPEYKQAPTLAVSDGTVSTATETPAEDYLIPDSQVFVAGKGGASRFLALLGVAIDRSRNESSVSGQADALRLKFKDQLEAALRRASSTSSIFKGGVNVVAGDADLLLIPAARLVVRDDSRADLSFRVTVRFKDPASGNEGRKNYWHVYGIRPLTGEGGWTDNKSSLLKSASDEVMNRVAQVIIEDLAGGYRDRLDPSKQQRIRWKALTGDQVATSILLKEEPGHFIVAPLLKDQPARGIVLIVPKDIVKDIVRVQP
jgi:hypothetical protein